MANSNMKDLRIGHVPPKKNIKSWQEVHEYPTIIDNKYIMKTQSMVTPPIQTRAF
jgi:hypothetical protein